MFNVCMCPVYCMSKVDQHPVLSSWEPVLCVFFWVAGEKGVKWSPGEGLSVTLSSVTLKNTFRYMLSWKWSPVLSLLSLIEKVWRETGSWDKPTTQWRFYAQYDRLRIFREMLEDVDKEKGVCVIILCCSCCNYAYTDLSFSVLIWYSYLCTS